MPLLIANDNAGLIFAVVFIAILLPLCIWLYIKIKAVADRKVKKEYLDDRGLAYKSIKSSWFPPAKRILYHRKGVLWHTVTLQGGKKAHIRVYMFLTKLISLDYYE